MNPNGTFKEGVLKITPELIESTAANIKFGKNFKSQLSSQACYAQNKWASLWLTLN